MVLFKFILIRFYHLLLIAITTHCFSEINNFNVALDYVENEFGPLSVIVARWNSPDNDVNVHHYLVEWRVENQTTKFSTADPILHNSTATAFEYVIYDIIQGECYCVKVTTSDMLSSETKQKNSTQITGNAVPYDITFAADDIEVNVTWKMQGNFTISYYFLTLFYNSTLPDASSSDTFPADSLQGTAQLLQGTTYSKMYLFVYVINDCLVVPNSWQPGHFSFNHTTAPPIPTDVTLRLTEFKHSFNVSWVLPNAFTWFTHTVNITSSDGSSTIYETDFTVESVDQAEFHIKIESYAYSERYVATVHVGNLRTTPIQYGRVSMPSNYLVTAPNLFFINKIQQRDGLLFMSWIKPVGGDYIDHYVIRIASLNRSEAFEETVSHLSGIRFYNHAFSTKNLSPAMLYDLQIEARNSAGVGFTPYYLFITLPEPTFNVTVVNLTTLRVDWDLNHENATTKLISENATTKFLIEYKSDIAFASISIPVNSTRSRFLSNLEPYTEYTVSMYYVLSPGYHGFDEDYSGTTQKTAFTFIQEFCDETILPHPDDGAAVTFPTTQAGYSNSSLNKCPIDTENGGISLATMTCSIDVVWINPTWLSSCGTTLQNLASVNISSDMEREEVATDLTVLTSDASSLNSDDISLSATALQSVVNADRLHQNTTSLVVESVGNLLAAPEDEFAASGAADSLLATLNKLAALVILENGEEFQSTSSTLAFSVIQTSKNETSRGVGFFERKNPLTEELGFSEKQFQTFYSNVTMQNTSSIWVPSEAVRKSLDARISFHAFVDNQIFQISDTSKSSEDTIPLDSTVRSKIILSASVNGSVVENLQQNVVITFNYTKISCPLSEDFGEYLCGFWNELDSVWSRYGCTLIYKSHEFVECQCDHLTNFATLFAYGKSEAISNNVALDILSYIGSGVSLVGSISTILCLIIVRCSHKPAIPKQTIFVMLNLAASLTLLNSLLLLSILESINSNPSSCAAIAIFLHFSLLSALMWTSVEAIYVCIGVMKPLYYRTELTHKKVMIASSMWGWGIPIAFVAFSAAINFSSYKRKDDLSNICWIAQDNMIGLIIIPAAIILCLNIIVYIIVVGKYATRKQVGDADNNQKITAGNSVAFSLLLFLMFGITWIFGFLLFDSSTTNIIFAYIFTITNSLQGFFIFLLFVVRNSKIRALVKRKVKDVTSLAGKANDAFLNDIGQATSK